MLRVSDGGEEAVGEADHRLDVLRLRLFEKPYSLVVADSERLFTAEWLSGVDRRLSHRYVQVVRRADVDCLNLRAVYEVVVVLESALFGDVVSLAGAVQAVFVYVAECPYDGAF